METSAARISADAYFELDAASEEKIEFYDGVTVAMAGASPRHNQVAGNVSAALRRTLAPRGYYVAQSDQRTRLAATRAWLYPDVVVSCAARFEGPRPQTLLNPELVVEVLSGSTEAHDLSAKLAHYRSTESIAEIVFVHLGERLVEYHRRIEPSKWIVTLARDGAVELGAIGAALAVEEVYAGVEGLPEE